MKPVTLCVLVFVVVANAATDLNHYPSTGSESSARFRPFNHLFRIRRDVDEKCEPGSTIMRDCNSCVCSKDGLHLACTRMECPIIPEKYKNPDGSLKSPEEVARIDGERPKREIETACVPGSFRKVECNTCSCVPDGSVEVCTKMFCLPPERRRRQALNCEPNSHFKMDCNTCTCTPDGRTAMCTLMACPPKYSEGKFAINENPRQK